MRQGERQQNGLDGRAQLVAQLRQNPSALAASAAGGTSGKKKVGSAAVAQSAARGSERALDERDAGSAGDAAAAMKAELAAQVERRRRQSSPSANGSPPSSSSQPPAPQPTDSREAPRSGPPLSDAMGEGTEDQPHPGRSETSEAATLELSDETLDAVLAEVVGRLPEAMAGQVQSHESAAVLPDGRLQLTFPGNNAFAREMLSRAASKTVLNRTASAVVGRSIEVVLRFTTAPPRPATSRPRRAETTRRDLAVVEADPFVQQVLETFGGKLVQVTAKAELLSLDTIARDAAVGSLDPDLDPELAAELGGELPDDDDLDD